PRPLLVGVGALTWALAYLAVLIGPLAGHRHQTIRRALHQALHVTIVGAQPSTWWLALIEVLIGAAVIMSVLAVHSLLAPASGGNSHDEREHRVARAIVWQH